MLSFRRCLAPSGASDESAKLVFTLTLLFVMSPFFRAVFVRGTVHPLSYNMVNLVYSTTQFQLIVSTLI